MSAWYITDNDRDEYGRIRTLKELLPSTPAVQEQQHSAPRRASYRPGLLELAAIVGGLALAAILIGLLNTFWPERAPRPLAPKHAPAYGAAPPTLAPRVTPTIATQAAYDRPGGTLMGPIPLSAPIVYQHSGFPGWGGVEWRGIRVWVQTDRALASLPDLAPLVAAPEPPAVEAPIVAAPAAAAAPMPYDSTHQKQHDEAGPPTHIKTQQAAAQTCWEGPPRANPRQLPRCWAGVPFVAPTR